MAQDDATLDLFDSAPEAASGGSKGPDPAGEGAGPPAQAPATQTGGKSASAGADADAAPAPRRGARARAPARTGGESAGEGGAASTASDAVRTDEPEVWTVSQVNRAVRNLLEGRLPSLWVSGEVANWKRAGSGHCYFTLKDENAQIRSVMWRRDATRLPVDPDDGMEVRAFGSLTLYEARGEYQFSVRKLEAAGADGLWRIAFEKLRARLEAEGLLAADRKRPIPRFPRTVGVVTSTTGAALRDILSVIGRRAPWTRVLVMGARVQGEGAALEIAHALRTLGRSGAVDVVIVGRGGGSIEDLWAFNEEPVARAVAQCAVPVISAVGHETDITISDLVADLRAPTPSAAGEAAVVDGAAVADYLRAVPARLAAGLRNSVELRRRRVDDGLPRLRRAMDRLVAPRRDHTARLRDRMAQSLSMSIERRRRRAAVDDRLARAMGVVLERRRQQLASLAGRLQALSPLSTLERGYAVPLTRDGAVLRSIDAFTPGRTFVLRVADGRVDCEAGAVHPDDLDFGPAGSMDDQE